MIELMGLEGYTGQRVAPPWLIEEQILYWIAMQDAQVELEKRRQAETQT